ncbi:hypothetical protein L6164_003171 [Bauhinia variegata]|uniref:Uncharacterized protein n=1 Tax=Bauhinia variegata TaxID=167791 RepID=A0ACB9Q007_BAUVA|nr:hypothetical protein L6164_003171 [Bauhinia variegata]
MRLASKDEGSYGQNFNNDDLKDDSSGDEGNDGDDFSSKAGCKIGLREKNKCPVKKDIDITNLDESCACKPKEEKKQLQAVKFKIMKKPISLSGVDSVAGNWEQQEGTVTGNVGANAVQNNFKKRGRKFGNLPTDRCLLGYGAPPPDKKATPRYVRSLKSTANVGTKLMSAGGASPGY